MWLAPSINPREAAKRSGGIKSIWGLPETTQITKCNDSFPQLLPNAPVMFCSINSPVTSFVCCLCGLGHVCDILHGERYCFVNFCRCVSSSDCTIAILHHRTREGLHEINGHLVVIFSSFHQGREVCWIFHLHQKRKGEQDCSYSKPAQWYMNFLDHKRHMPQCDWQENKESFYRRTAFPLLPPLFYISDRWWLGVGNGAACFYFAVPAGFLR